MSEHPRRAPLDVDGVRRDLVGAGRPLRRIEVVESTGSTNADLLARHGAGDDITGTVLIAEHQTAGRGRHGRSWSAPPRSQVAFSLGVDAVGLPPASWGWVPLLTGVAVVDAVRATAGVAAGLKWPNDIQVGAPDWTGKLGGILAEVASPDPVIVVGVGLNVTLTAEEAPDPRATSLLMLGSTMLDRSALLGSILAELTARIDRWRHAGEADSVLRNDYLARSVTLGKAVRAELPGGGEIVGTATGIYDTGQLLIDTGEQNVTVSAGDVTHLRGAD